MSDILRDFSPASLVTAIQENLLAIIAAFRRWPRAEVHDDAEISWTITDLPSPLFNGIYRAQLPAENVEPTIHALTAAAGARNVPLMWWIGPATRPADIEARLQQHGFVPAGDMPGMAAVLADLKQPPPAPAGFSIQPVNDAAALALWGQTMGLGFGLPEFVTEAFGDFMAYVDPHVVQAYLGWLNGRPVATSLLILAAGVAGLYNVTTIPAAQRQGIGALMTVLPLREARARGYQAGILHASEMGAGVYRSLGFQEYCRIKLYGWSPEQAPDAGQAAVPAPGPRPQLA